MIASIDAHRGACGVGPICGALPAKPRSGLRGIAPSTYREHAARRADPSRVPARAQRDAGLQGEVRRVFEGNLGVHGVRKVRRPLRREGVPVARCTVARLLRGRGLAGVVRGKPVRTTVGDKAVRAPAPNMLWMPDFTHVATSAFRGAKAPGSGLVDVAFVVEPRGSPDIGAFTRRIVGWQVSRSAHAGFVLDDMPAAA